MPVYTVQLAITSIMHSQGLQKPFMPPKDGCTQDRTADLLRVKQSS